MTMIQQRPESILTWLYELSRTIVLAYGTPTDANNTPITLTSSDEEVVLSPNSVYRFCCNVDCCVSINVADGDPATTDSPLYLAGEHPIVTTDTLIEFHAVKQADADDGVGTLTLMTKSR